MCLPPLPPLRQAQRQIPISPAIVKSSSAGAVCVYLCLSVSVCGAHGCVVGPQTCCRVCQGHVRVRIRQSRSLRCIAVRTCVVEEIVCEEVVCEEIVWRHLHYLQQRTSRAQLASLKAHQLRCNLACISPHLHATSTPASHAALMHPRKLSVLCNTMYLC